MIYGFIGLGHPGGKLAASPVAVAAICDADITCLPSPAVVRRRSSNCWRAR